MKRLVLALTHCLSVDSGQHDFDLRKPFQSKHDLVLMFWRVFASSFNFAVFAWVRSVEPRALFCRALVAPTRICFFVFAVFLFCLFGLSPSHCCFT